MAILLKIRINGFYGFMCSPGRVDRSAFLEKNSPCLVALWFETHVLCYGFEKGKPIPQGT